MSTAHSSPGVLPEIHDAKNIYVYVSLQKQHIDKYTYAHTEI